MKIDIDKLKLRDNRLRTHCGDLKGLKSSISEIGLIYPIIIDEDYYIIAGFRRFNACKELKLTEVKVEKLEGLSEFGKFAIEFDENNRRKNLDPVETAVGNATRKRLYLKEHPETKREATLKVGEENPSIDSESVSRKVKMTNRALPVGLSEKIVERKKKSQEILDLSNRLDEETPQEIEIVLESEEPTLKLEEISKRYTSVAAEKAGVSESTIKRQVQIGEAILDGHIPEEMVEEYRSGKIIQQEIMKEIRTKKPKDKSKRKMEKVRSKIKKRPEKIKYCRTCVKGFSMYCPSCNEKIIICQKYKTPSIKPEYEVACLNYEEP